MMTGVAIIVGFWCSSILVAYLMTALNRIICRAWSGICGWILSCSFFTAFILSVLLDDRVMAGRDRVDALVWGIPIGLSLYSFVLLAWITAVARISYGYTHPYATARDWFPVAITPLFLGRTRRTLLWRLHVRLEDIDRDADLMHRLTRDWMTSHLLRLAHAWTTRRRAEIALITQHGLRAKGPA